MSFAAERGVDVVNRPGNAELSVPADRLPRQWRVTLLATLLLVAAPLSAASSSASGTVEALHAGLLEVMQNADTLGFEGRRAKLAPLVEKSYDMPFVTGMLLGSSWSGLDEAARQRAVETMTRHTVATYASRFDGFSGERFETISQATLGHGREHVRTVIVESDGETTQLDYVLHDAGGTMRIINVVADGVSDLALKRSEYAAVIREEGLSGLMDRLERQIAAYAAQNG